MYLSTVALCTWHSDKLVLRTCTFPTYSKFFVSVYCLPCAHFLCVKVDVCPDLLCTSLLTSTALKRSSSSSSGGIGSFSPAVCFWGPVEPGGPDTILASFAWGPSTLPAAFPMTVCSIDPKTRTYTKTFALENQSLPNTLLDHVYTNMRLCLLIQSYITGCVWLWAVTFHYFHDPSLKCHSLLVHILRRGRKRRNEIHPCL